MESYSKEKSYQEIVNNNIERAKYLNNLSDKGISIISELLDKKEKLRKKNGILAFVRINRIERKIEKKIEKYKKLR